MGILNVWSENSSSQCMRYQRKKTKYQQYILHILLCATVVLYYSKDKWYFVNGTGGTGWQIGSSIAHIGNANQTRTPSELRTFALELVNRDRLLNGLPALVETPLLSRSAQGHAEDMMKRNYYDHVTPEGRTPTERYNHIGGTGGVGENIMYLGSSPTNYLNFGLLERFQRSWMYSNGHRVNLLTPNYRYFGYGIVVDPISREVYAVQNFQ